MTGQGDLPAPWAPDADGTWSYHDSVRARLRLKAGARVLGHDVGAFRRISRLRDQAYAAQCTSCGRAVVERQGEHKLYTSLLTEPCR